MLAVFVFDTLMPSLESSSYMISSSSIKLRYIFLRDLKSVPSCYVWALSISISFRSSFMSKLAAMPSSPSSDASRVGYFKFSAVLKVPGGWLYSRCTSLGPNECTFYWMLRSSLTIYAACTSFVLITLHSFSCSSSWLYVSSWFWWHSSILS